MRQAGRLLWCALCCAALTGCETAARPSTDQSAQENFSEIPSSQSDEENIRTQIERNWNLGSLAGSPSLKDAVIKLRVTLLPDGTVTKTQLLNAQPGNPDFSKVAEGAIRAVMISSPLTLPPGKIYNSLDLMFHPGEIVD